MCKPTYNLHTVVCGKRRNRIQILYFYSVTDFTGNNNFVKNIALSKNNYIGIDGRYCIKNIFIRRENIFLKNDYKIQITITVSFFYICIIWCFSLS